jgi:hypothetical protein
MKMIQESLINLTTKVTDNQDKQKQAMQQLEHRCNEKIQTSHDEQQNHLEQNNRTLLQQMHTDQATNINLLRSILEERENSIEKKINGNFQAILEKLNFDHASPTRKKLNQSSTNIGEENDEQMTEGNQVATPNHSPKLINPYIKTSSQRRSVETTLPTNLP